MTNETDDPQQEKQQQAENLSRRWADRLDDFDLPCPLCRGELIFQGVRSDRLFEFAEGEPGVVNLQDILPITFVCNRCGYTADFDSGLFNPAYLASLQKAQPERVAHLKLRKFRVFVPLSGNENSHTLLDLASALASEQDGEVLVIPTIRNEELYRLLREKLQAYVPGPGRPAPTLAPRSGSSDPGEIFRALLSRQPCNLMLVGAQGWDRGQEAGMGAVIDSVLEETMCEVAVVHDRGMRNIDRVLLATAGGPNARAAAPLALSLARAYDAELHLLYVARPDQPGSDTEGQQRMLETLGDIGQVKDIKVKQHVVFERDPTQALISQSADYDLLLLGASPKNWRGKIKLSSLASRVARNSDITTLVVLARENGPKTWRKRLFG